MNVSPSAVEQVLAQHPSVADVCITGAPDDEWGERVVAFVVVAVGHDEPTVAELREFSGRACGRPSCPARWWRSTRSPAPRGARRSVDG